MNQWVNRKLREVGTLERGRSRHRPRYAFHLYNGPYPFIQTGEVRAASKYISSYKNTYSKDGLKQSKLWPKGTLCITIAANIAELAILDFDACFPDSVLGFIPDTTKTNIDYVFYTLSHYQRRLKHIGEGSVQDNINLGTFEDIEFPFPPISEQKAITSVLCSLDEKIDLLHHQNNTLESMAETLFRQWFIEDAQNDWEAIPLSKVATFTNGLACQKFPAIPGKPSMPVLKIKELSSGISSSTNLATANIKENYIVNHGDVIFAWSASLMVKVWSGPVCVLNQHLFKVSSDTYPKWFYLEWCKHYLEEFISISQSHATTMGHIKRKDLDEAMVKIPSNNELVSMTAEIEPLLDQRIEKMRQIRTLETLRDTLLPKLMSGEVRVQYAEEAIASVANN